MQNITVENKLVNFTQGGKYDHKWRSQRIIIDDAEYDFIIVDATSRGMYVYRKDAFLSDGTNFITIVTYNVGNNPQYKVFMGVYAGLCFFQFAINDEYISWHRC